MSPTLQLCSSPGQIPKSKEFDSNHLPPNQQGRIWVGMLAGKPERVCLSGRHEVTLVSPDSACLREVSYLMGVALINFQISSWNFRIRGWGQKGATRENFALSWEYFPLFSHHSHFLPLDQISSTSDWLHQHQVSYERNSDTPFVRRLSVKFVFSCNINLLSLIDTSDDSHLFLS